jgi:hypothetical protein
MKALSFFEKALYICAFFCLFSILQQDPMTWEFANDQVTKALAFASFGLLIHIGKKLWETAD